MIGEKLVILKLYSDVEAGFLVVLEIEPQGLPKIEASGRLPPPIHLVQAYQQWQATYRDLGQTLRSLKPRQVRNLGLKQRKLRCRDAAQTLQQALNQWLRADSFLTIREVLLKQVSISDRVRVIIRSQETTIWQLPWHQWDFLRDYDNIEVSFSALQSGAVTPSHSAATPPHTLRILVVLGDATGINVQEDRRLFKQLSANSLINFLVEPKREALIETLQNNFYDFLFFAGHSRTERGLGFIDLNSTDSLTLEELQTRLKLSIQKGLQLAIFNSCDGLGLVKALEHLQIPCLIVMREPIPDAVAQAFLKAFLQALSRGIPFHLAAREAREELQKFEDDFPCASWLPMIWQSSSAAPSWGDLLKRSPLTPPVKPKRRHFRSIWHRFRIPVAISLVSLAIVMGLRLSGVLQSAELVAFDHLINLRPNEGVDPNLLIIEITQADIEAQKQNHELMQRRSISAQTLGETFNVSLSDTSLNRLLTILVKYQPRVIGLDILRDFPIEPGQTSLAKYFKDSSIIAVCKAEDFQDASIPSIDPPPEILLSQVGFGDFQPDPDGRLRRHLLSFYSPLRTPKSRCNVDNSFSVQIAFKYLHSRSIPAQFTDDDLQLGSQVFKRLRLGSGGYQKVELGGSQILLNYRSAPEIAQRISLSQLLNNQINADYIKDKIVLVGVTAESAKDYWDTSYAPDPTKRMSGVIVQAHMISQLLSAAMNQRPLLWVWSQAGEILWILGWSLVGSTLAWKLDQRNLSMKRSLLQTGLAISLAASLLYGICLGTLLIGGWIPLIPSIFTLTLSGLMTRFYLMYRSPLLRSTLKP